MNETTSPTSQHPETPPSGEHENVSPTETESTPLNPGDADAHYQKGLELKARGRHREARDAFEYALLLDPGHIDADNALIEALLSDAHRLNQGSSLEGSENVASGDATPRQRSEEVNETTSPTSQHPETPPSGERENVLPTETVVNESTPLNLENVDAHYQRGLDLKARWRHREAVEIFEQVIRLKPDNADAYYQKGLSYSRLGKHAEALEAFEEVTTRLNPQHINAHFNRGIALRDLENRNEEAVKAFEKVIGLNPGDADAYYQMGMVLAKQGKDKEAWKAFENATHFDPSDAETHYQKGMVLVKLKKYKEAAKAFEEATKINPNNANAHYQKGLALSELGDDYQGAAEAFEKVISLNAQQLADAYSQMGRVLTRLGRSDEAQAAFDMARVVRGRIEPS